MFKQKKIIRIVVSAIIILLILLPTFLTTKYVFMVQDDFWWANKYHSAIQKKSYIWQIIQYIIEDWRVISGVWFGRFTQYFFSFVFDLGENNIGITICCIINLGLFFLSLWYFLYTTVEFWIKNVDFYQIFLLYILLILCVVNIEVYSDNYFWYCCSVSYLLPVCLALFGSGLFLRALSDNSKWKIIMAGLLGMVSGGAPLVITALSCGCYFLIAVWGIAKRKQAAYCTIGFGMALCGGV